MTWDNVSVFALLPVAALMLIGPLARRRGEDLPHEFRGLADAADLAERERDELRSRIRHAPF